MCYIKSFYIDIILKQKQILTAPCEKYKIVCFTSSMMKNIFVFPSQSRLVVELICCIAFGSASSACCLLKFVAIIL